MKILVCSFEYYPVGSGIANITYNIVNELKKKHDVDVCSPVGPEIKLGSWPLIEKIGGFGILHYWWKTCNYIKKNIDKYDIVLMENALVTNKLYSPKIFITVHTTYDEFYDQVKDHCGFIMKQYYLLMRFIEKRLYNKLDKRIKFTATSDCVVEEISKLGIPKKNIIYVPNGAEIDRFKPVSDAKKKQLKKKFKLDTNKLAILFVGRLEHQHQPEDLIRILYNLKQKRDDVQFVIVGNGSLREETRNLAKKLKVKDIKFIDKIEYKILHEMYQSCDLFILNSLYTGQSAAMMEAAGCGCPLLVPDITEFKRIVKHSKIGLLYHPTDVKKAASQIDKYLKKVNIKEEQRKMRKYIEQTNTWAIAAKQYVDYFKS